MSPMRQRSQRGTRYLQFWRDYEDKEKIQLDLKNKMPLPKKHRSPLRCKDNNMILIKIALLSIIIIQIIYAQCKPFITKETLNSFNSKILFWKCPENRTLKDFEQILFISNQFIYEIKTRIPRPVGGDEWFSK